MFRHDIERALCRFWLRGQCAKGGESRRVSTISNRTEADVPFPFFRTRRSDLSEQCEVSLSSSHNSSTSSRSDHIPLFRLLQFIHTLPSGFDPQALSNAIANIELSSSPDALNGLNRQQGSSSSTPLAEDFPELGGGSSSSASRTGSASSRVPAVKIDLGRTRFSSYVLSSLPNSRSAADPSSSLSFSPLSELSRNPSLNPSPSSTDLASNPLLLPLPPSHPSVPPPPLATETAPSLPPPPQLPTLSLDLPPESLFDHRACSQRSRRGRA